MSTYRVILADDHVIFCQGLKKIVEEIPGLTVVGQANDGLELLTMLKSVTADLVILDISMPNIRGIEAAREIQKESVLQWNLLITIALITCMRKSELLNTV